MKRLIAITPIAASVIGAVGCATVTGAAVGAGIGAIAGDTGKGAAIGAGVGAVIDIID